MVKVTCMYRFTPIRKTDVSSGDSLVSLKNSLQLLFDCVPIRPRDPSAALKIRAKFRSAIVSVAAPIPWRAKGSYKALPNVLTFQWRRQDFA